MAHSYTPGLRVAETARITKKRLLPIKGGVMVQSGQPVASTDVIARTELPGKVHTVNVINLLSIDKEQIRSYLLKKEGEKIAKDEPLAENRPLIKWFKTVVKSPITGTVESISQLTGQVLLREPAKPLELLAYIDGTVEEIIRGEGATVSTSCSFVQGIFGIGGETSGILEMACTSPDQELAASLIKESHKGKIIIGGSHVSMAAIRRAIAVGAAGVVVGGIHDKDIREILGYDLGVAITGTEKIGLTLIITEGFGKISMAQKTFDLLRSKVGRKACISGATQIRAGVIRPEIIIPFSAADQAKKAVKDAAGEREGMKPGDPIRIIRDPFFGIIAKVKDLPQELVNIETESKARVLVAEFPDGKCVVIPRANVEIIEN